MQKIYIVIIRFNSLECFYKLLDSLSRIKISGWETNIVIVDNGGSKDVIGQQSLANIKLIKNKKNLGFAGGCNVGIRYALENKADSILLLNQDTVVDADFLESLINNPADIIAPVIKFKRGNDWIYDFGGRVNWLWGRTKHIECNNITMKQCSNDDIDYVSGCCMMVRREVFEKIGLLDERFFLYLEDADFCTRATMMGLKIAVEQKSVIIHNLIEGAKKPFSSQVELIKSNFKFINKYLGVRRLLGYLYLAVLTFKMFFGGRTSLRGATSYGEL